MNRVITIVALSMLAISSCYAELQVDNTLSRVEVYTKIIKPRFNSTIIPYVKQYSWLPEYFSEHVYDNEPGPDHLAWIFKKNKYYSTVGSYIPLDDINKKYHSCNNNEINCRYIFNMYADGYVCHVFIFDEKNLNEIAAVTALNVKTNKSEVKGLPRCDDALAMAPAGEGLDAMLITLEYSDSSIEDSPYTSKAPERYRTSILLKWHEENGKLKIEQDDSCLGNPNNIATIAEARKRLKRCQGK